MKKNRIAIISDMTTLAWVLPMPVWPSLKLASQSMRQTYVLSNQSTENITITGLGFDPGQDPRLGFVGGTCHIGLVLVPQASCTIDIQVTPRALGIGKHLLTIQHSGQSSPLWTEILFSVVAQGENRVRKVGYLSDDTQSMDRQRRLKEQDGHRYYARVHARSHPDPEQMPQQQMAQDGEVQNNILQNPWLNSQRFDGVDPNLNPEPPLNTEARREFDNERREQEMEKQLRLGNMPKMSSAPKPPGF